MLLLLSISFAEVIQLELVGKSFHKIAAEKNEEKNFEDMTDDELNSMIGALDKKVEKIDAKKDSLPKDKKDKSLKEKKNTWVQEDAAKEVQERRTKEQREAEKKAKEEERRKKYEAAALERE